MGSVPKKKDPSKKLTHCMALLVPKYRHRPTFCIGCISQFVNLSQICFSFNFILRGTGAGIKTLAFVREKIMNDINGNISLKAFEGADDEYSMSPGTGVGYVEVDGDGMGNVVNWTFISSILNEIWVGMRVA